MFKTAKSRRRLSFLLALVCVITVSLGSLIPVYALETNVTYTATEKETTPPTTPPAPTDPDDTNPDTGDHDNWFIIDTSIKTTGEGIEDGEIGGTVDPAGKTAVARGQNIKVIITPNEGYKISSVVVDGKDIGPVGAVYFDNVSRSHTLVAFFEKADEPEAEIPDVIVEDDGSDIIFTWVLEPHETVKTEVMDTAGDNIESNTVEAWWFLTIPCIFLMAYAAYLLHQQFEKKQEDGEHEN